MSIAAAFDTFNPIRLQSELLERIWRDGFGEEYASEAQPNAFYPKAALTQIGNALLGKTLLDIGCGHGLTGAYLARQRHLDLLGIDVSPVSIEVAKRQNGRFWVASAEDTGLQEQVDNVICMDVMLYLNKPVAIREIARILKPDGCFAFTTWEQKGYNARLNAEQVEDYRPLLAEHFDVVDYQSHAHWMELQNRVLDGIIQHVEPLKSEIGVEPASMLFKMARSMLDESQERHYVLVIARRKA